MSTLAVLQVAEAPAWVGPTMAVSLAVIALAVVLAAAVVVFLGLRVAGEVKRVRGVVERLQDEAAQGLASARRLLEQGQDLAVVIRQEAGAYAQTSQRIRRKLVRGTDRLEAKLVDLETLYDLIHEELEDTALDVTATLRSSRQGNGMLGRVRRLLVPGR
jgi:hypothetical protein